MENQDTAGYPQRWPGDRLIINSRRVIVLGTDKPLVLCPCPDSLLVQYVEDGSTARVDNGNYDSWDLPSQVLCS